MVPIGRYYFRSELHTLHTNYDEQLSDIFTRIAASHARFDIEEDYHILRQADYLCMFTVVSDDEDCNPESWIHPIGVVHQIYDYFDLHWSNEMEMTIRDWLLKNPQGKQGRHTYSLAEFGLNREDIETLYADYTNLFLSSDNQSSSTTSISL
ncbi:unnamed protein product [Rotaria sordida]|uniref:Uncharacterized protein n=2 Tax=Rotaria sordida TaxID=392033 RepID=A0A815PZQ3_9BILA|nr:unnamed protein product [Rotaria sordida]CAF1456634.1 unnamed protein product [Rotaria sordida]